LQKDLRKFRRHWKDDEPNSKGLQLGEKKEVDLWDYMTDIITNFQCPSEPVMFKSKDPKRYLQVKT
jgi:hypothetical protein